MLTQDGCHAWNAHFFQIWDTSKKLKIINKTKNLLNGMEVDKHIKQVYALDTVRMQ